MQSLTNEEGEGEDWNSSKGTMALENHLEPNPNTSPDPFPSPNPNPNPKTAPVKPIGPMTFMDALYFVVTTVLPFPLPSLTLSLTLTNPNPHASSSSSPIYYHLLLEGSRTPLTLFSNFHLLH
jgi:hypothetical protein